MKERAVQFVVLFSFTIILVCLLGLEPNNANADVVEGDSQDVSVFLPALFKALTPIIPDTTVILSETTTESIVSVSPDGAIYTFDNMSTELAALDTGDIMVSGPASAAPFGFIRQVLKIDSSGASVVVTTAPAVLEEAVEQGSFGFRRAFTPDDVVATRAIDNVSVQSVILPTGDEGWYVEISGPDLGCIKASGSVSISNLNIDASGQIERFKLTYFRSVVDVDVADDLKFEVLCQQSLLDEEVPIAQFFLGAIVVPIGPLPVVFTVTLDVTIGAEGKVQLGAVFEGVLDLHLRAGAVYRDGDFDIVGEFDADLNWKPPQPKAGFNVKGYAGPEVQLLLYGFPGVFVRNSGFLEFDVDAFDPEVWRLYWGVEAPVGLELDILGTEIAEYEAFALRYRAIMAEGGGGTAPNETLYLNSYELANDGAAGPVFGTFVLQEGEQYIATVTGSISVWYPYTWSSVCKGKPDDFPLFPSPNTLNGDVGTDAGYIFAVIAGDVNCDLPENAPIPLDAWLRPFEVTVDNGVTWQDMIPNEAAYNPEHEYTFAITGGGYPPQFRWVDHPTDDNYGMIVIKY